MGKTEITIYKYRWVVLGSFMLINAAVQLLWISFAPVTSIAASYYGVSDLRIGFLSMIFMIAFIPFSLPVSWGIDTFGFHKTVGFGAILMGIFAVIRGCAGQNYTFVMLATLGIAIAQPFMLNAWTKVPAAWFPTNARATAVGLITLANLVGTALGLVLTPILVTGGMLIGKVQLIYGIAALLSAIIFIALAREKPATPPCAEEEQVRSLMLAGLKHALSVKKFWYSLIVSFIGMGIFNGVSTWIENIIKPRGFSPTDAGIVGALMIVGGLIGAVILPAFSDHFGKRRPFMHLSFAGAIPGLLGLTFAQNPLLLFSSSFMLGFFLVSAMPVVMQYATEVSAPTPEGTSNGLFQLCGQGAVVFVYLMEALKMKDGSFTPSLLLAGALLVLSLGLIFLMKDK